MIKEVQLFSAVAFIHFNSITELQKIVIVRIEWAPVRSFIVVRVTGSREVYPGAHDLVRQSAVEIIA